MKTTTKTKGWPPERRRAQSLRLKSSQIWRRSTGPRTAAGKARSARNACRHGHRSAAANALNTWLTRQSRFRRAVLAWHELGLGFPKTLREEGHRITIALAHYTNPFTFRANIPKTIRNESG